MRKTDAFRRAAALVAALSITVSLAAPAFAETYYYIDDGDITITKDENGQTVKQGNKEAENIGADEEIIITTYKEATTTLESDLEGPAAEDSGFGPVVEDNYQPAQPESTEEPEGTDQPEDAEKPEGTDQPEDAEEPKSADQPENTDRQEDADQPESAEEPEGADQQESAGQQPQPQQAERQRQRRRQSFGAFPLKKRMLIHIVYSQILSPRRSPAGERPCGTVYVRPRLSPSPWGRPPRR